MGNTCLRSRLGKNGFILPEHPMWQPSEVAGSSQSGDTMSHYPFPTQSQPPHTIVIQPHTIVVQIPPQTSPSPSPNPTNSDPNPKPNPSAKPKQEAATAALTTCVLARETENFKSLYTLGKKLGQGQFGTTYLCIGKASGKEFACKSISKRKLLSSDDVKDVRREIQIMHHLAGHPNIVGIQGAYEDATHVHLVMELCVGGELFDRIIKRGHFSERRAAELLRTIVGVIQTCHSLGVMHRDLKPENFLFQSKSENAPLKTIDFGLSIFFKPGEIFHDVVGSPYYVAPEVLRKHYSAQADVWSCGVILYILLSGVPPFWAETEQGIFEQVLRGDIDFRSNPWPHISESAKDLIRKMLNRNVEKRYTAYDVLCHPWVREDGVAPDKPLDAAVLTRMKQFMAMNKMKKIALRVIAKRLSEEEIAGLKEVFKMMDTDDSGTITFDELRDGLRRLGSPLMDSEIRTIMEAADVDNSGTIDYTEFIAATLHLNKMEHDENLLAAFSYFDKDGSGYITVDELQQACVEHNMTDVHIEEVIREIDQDNDGRIDYNEFVAMMRKGEGGAVRRNNLTNTSTRRVHFIT